MGETSATLIPFVTDKFQDDHFDSITVKRMDRDLCSVYDKRLAMCKRYPAPRIYYPADLHDGCGYTIHKKHFTDYLNKEN